jgi:hypothetical protein
VSIHENYQTANIQVLASIPSDSLHSDTIVSISRQAKDDLLIWACWLSSDHKWLPIAIGREMYIPPFRHKEFVSDAAGLCEMADWAGSPGWGNIELKEDGTIIFVDQSNSRGRHTLFVTRKTRRMSDSGRKLQHHEGSEYIL